MGPEYMQQAWKWKAHALDAALEKSPAIHFAGIRFEVCGPQMDTLLRTP